jgi:hypothetical protein
MPKMDKLIAVEDAVSDAIEVLEQTEKLAEVIHYHIEMAEYLLVKANCLMEEMEKEKEGK